MLNIEQFHYGADNLAYLIYGREQAMAVDGGASHEILSFLRNRNLRLAFITNTHSHHDHTSGNDHLLKETGVALLRPSILMDNQQIIIDGKNISVYRTPGHTDDSVCFHSGNFLITGDTLFNGTIGNCFSGNQRNFYLSIKRLMTLPDKTTIYAGHDYVTASLAFALFLEPDNHHIESFRKHYNAAMTTSSTMAQERNINPYLRFNEESIIRVLKKNNLPHATEYDRWNSLMSIE